MPEIPRFGRRTLLVSTALAAIAAAMVVVLFGGSNGRDDGTSTIPTIKVTDEKAVDPATVTMTGFDGQKVLFTPAVKGQPTVINFFASTCVPCITEMPDLERVHQQMGDKVQFLGLALQDRIAASEELIQKTGISYRTARDPDGSIFQLFNGTVLPMTVLLDANGSVKAVHPGPLTDDELRSLIAEKLGIST